MTRDTTVDRVLHQAVVRGPESAFRHRRGGEWVSISFREYAEKCHDFAGGLLSEGHEPGQAVAILGNNCPEWVIADVGAMAARGVPAGVYQTLTAEQVAYVIGHAEAPVAVVENAEQWKKLEQQRHNLPNLRRVVLVKDAREVEDPRVISFEEFCEKGRARRREVEERLARLSEDETATLVYTSGTTGPPKGAMLTHSNLAYMARTGMVVRGPSTGDSVVSYLPLSHIAEQMFTIHVPAVAGATVTFAETMEKLREALLVGRPTIFLGVPRVWEKFKTALEARFAEARGAKAHVVRWARHVGLHVGRELLEGRDVGPLARARYRAADYLFFSKLKRQLGLDRLAIALTGAAPVSRDVLDFFLSCGIVLHEVYGQTEGGGATSVNSPGRTRFGTVGRPIPGADVKIAEDGEILMRSPGVFRGYLRDESATREILSDGWLRTGDVGEIDADGFVRITDRKKDLIITSGGKNVAPQNIEKLLKAIDGIGQVVVVGDRRPFLTALLTIDVERAKRLAAREGWPEDPRTLATHAPFLSHVARGVEGVNAGLARYETIKVHAVLPVDFSLEGGELTPSQKVKRNVVLSKYSEEIERMYQGATASR